MIHQMRFTAFDQAGHLRLQMEPWQIKEKFDDEAEEREKNEKRRAEEEAHRRARLQEFERNLLCRALLLCDKDIG